MRYIVSLKKWGCIGMCIFKKCWSEGPIMRCDSILSCRYRTTGFRKMCEFCCFSLSFSNDGSVLAIASSYMYEHEEVPDNIPEDAIYVRYEFQQCCGSGFGDPLLFWLRVRNPGQFFPDLGYRINNQYFWELSNNFLNSLCQLAHFSLLVRNKYRQKERQLADGRGLGG